MTPRTKNVMTIAGFSVLSAVVTFVIGFGALVTMPCAWFGSSFEGGCGYGAVYAVLLAAPFVWSLLVALLCLWHFGFRRRHVP